MLGLDMKEACRLAEVGKRTLTEFEAGKRSINSVTEAKLKALYISMGVEFASDFERVSFHTADAALSTTQAGPALKREYVDILQLQTARHQIVIIAEMLNSLAKRPSASQILIKQLLAKTGFSQKELASEFGCSSAFINAIVVGNKSFPSAYSSKFNELFPRSGIDLSKTVNLDKSMRRYELKIAESVEAYLNALNEMSQILENTLD